jgi:hypothetical protein
MLAWRQRLKEEALKAKETKMEEKASPILRYQVLASSNEPMKAIT